MNKFTLLPTQSCEHNLDSKKTSGQRKPFLKFRTNIIAGIESKEK